MESGKCNSLSYVSLKQTSLKTETLALLIGIDTYYLKLKKTETKKDIAKRLRILADQLENN